MSRPARGRAARTAALAAAVAAAALGVLPALPWYAVAAGGGTERATAFEGSGELWVLPLIAALGLGLAALPLAGAGRERAVGAGLVALGALAAFWTVRNLLAPPVVLRVGAEPGVTVPAPVTLEPAALAAPVAAAVLVLGGLALLRPPLRWW